MDQFIIDPKGADKTDVETYQELESGQKIAMFVDETICRDVYIGKDGVPRIACRVDLNGYTFYLFPGKNENVPEAVAQIIMTSPQNSKFATYDYNNGYRGYAAEAKPIEDIAGFNSSINFMLENNINAARQLQAIREM